jgi:hypothetical protein
MHVGLLVPSTRLLSLREERVLEDPRTVENPLRFDIPSAAVGQARSLRGPRRPALRRRMAPPHKVFITIRVPQAHP